VIKGGVGGGGGKVGNPKRKVSQSETLVDLEMLLFSKYVKLPRLVMFVELFQDMLLVEVGYTTEMLQRLA